MVAIISKILGIDVDRDIDTMLGSLEEIGVKDKCILGRGEERNSAFFFLYIRYWFVILFSFFHMHVFFFL
jgi:hypothetical protein